MAEDRLISTSRLTASEVARHNFGMVRKGFDPREVRAYLESLARELQALEQREEELRQNLAAAESRAEHPVLDEARLTAALGAQSAQVLRQAHEEAARVAQQGEERAAALLHEAQQQASDLVIGAESAAAERIAEAELAAAALHQEAETAAESAAAAARTDADRIAAMAREQGKAVVEQAQEARRRVLADAAQRRRGLQIQIEQLRAARDQLAERVVGVRRVVDEILAGLAGADDEARAAAAEVARRQVPEVDTEDEALGVPVDDLPPIRIEAGQIVPDGAEPLEADEVTVADQAAAAPAEDTLPPPPTPEGVAGGPIPEAAPAPGGRSVDELFARIRESHGQAVAEPDPVEPAVDGDAALLEMRAEVLDPISAKMVRRLKRALADDQNRLLDQLRSGTGEWSEVVVGPDDDHRAFYVEASVGALEAAVAAGGDFAAKLAGNPVSPGTPPPELARPAAERLSATVVTLLRRRLSGAEGDGGDSGTEDAGERVHAAFREWRGERIERLVGDVALSAFSAGVLAGRREGVGVRWVVGSSGPACADCDDNALAGVLGLGDEFPTGHLHPPAHVGCRCLVVLTPG